ncbi:MAG: hypothetical protein JWM59_2867 [Verrucomicrobiales bacterium]|nr:hypothetical protein [Verrucomicrobiales bacterium]
MLNIRFAFDDAIRAVTLFSDELRIPSLPAAVLLMQGDVINHYRHALNHYLTISLSAPFLQNSSLGTPYQKWVRVNNDNFELLAFAIQNLLRYSSRLFHETEHLAMIRERNFTGHAERSNAYTSPIVESSFRGAKIGFEVLPDEEFLIRHIRQGPLKERFGQRGSPGTPMIYFRMDDTQTPPREIEIDPTEYQASTAVIWERRVSIHDRSNLFAIQDEAQKELDLLDGLHFTYVTACGESLMELNPYQKFEEMNESYWI